MLREGHVRNLSLSQFQKRGKTGNELLRAVRSGIVWVATASSRKADHLENHRLEVLQVFYESIMRKWKMIFSFFRRGKSHTLKTQLTLFVSLKTPPLDNAITATLDIPISHRKKRSNLFANTTTNSISLTHQSPHPLLGTL